MAITVSPMTRNEVGAVADLWRQYMTETFGAAGPMTADVFLRDGLGGAFSTMVARSAAGAPIAAACGG